MIEMKLDLREPEELRAAAKFFAELADAQDAARQRRMKDYGPIGAIKGAAENRAQAEDQPAAAPAPAPVVAETPKKETAKKAKSIPPVFPEASSEAPPETPEPAAPEPAAPPPPSRPGITIEDIRQVMYDTAKAGHKAAVKEKLFSYGVKEIKDLPEEHWADYKQYMEGLNG